MTEDILFGTKRIKPRIVLNTTLARRLRKLAEQGSGQRGIHVFDVPLEGKQPHWNWPKAQHYITVMGIESATAVELLPEHFHYNHNLDFLVVEFSSNNVLRQTQLLKRAVTQCYPDNIVVICKERYSTLLKMNIMRWVQIVIRTVMNGCSASEIPAIHILTEDDILQLLYTDRKVQWEGRATEALNVLHPLDVFLLYCIAYTDDRRRHIFLDNAHTSPPEIERKSSSCLALSYEWYADRGVIPMGRMDLLQQYQMNDFLGLKPCSSPFSNYKGPNHVSNR